MRAIKLGAICLLTSIMLLSCATSALERRLDEKLAKEPARMSRRDLNEKAVSLMKNVAGITPTQRDQLNALRAQIQAKLAVINAESMRVRSVLLMDVMANRGGSAEIDALKARLRQLSQYRIDTIFEEVNQAIDVLGRTALIQEAMDLQLMQDEATDL